MTIKDLGRWESLEMVQRYEFDDSRWQVSEALQSKSDGFISSKATNSFSKP